MLLCLLGDQLYLDIHKLLRTRKKHTNPSFLDGAVLLSGASIKSLDGSVLLSGASINNPHFEHKCMLLCLLGDQLYSGIHALLRTRKKHTNPSFLGGAVLPSGASTNSPHLEHYMYIDRDRRLPSSATDGSCAVNHRRRLCLSTIETSRTVLS